MCGGKRRGSLRSEAVRLGLPKIDFEIFKKLSCKSLIFLCCCAIISAKQACTRLTQDTCVSEVGEMNVISLKEYAQNNRISYEAVRQQVVRYAEELGDHIIKDGRQQFLDEEAVAFLDGKRQKNPVVIYQASKDEEIERLENQNKDLLIEIANLQKQLLQAQSQNYQLQLEAGKVQQLEADNEAARRRAEQAEHLASERQIELAKARDEAKVNADRAAEEKQRRLEVERTVTEKDHLIDEKDLAIDERDQIIEDMRNAGLMKRIFGWR